MPQTIKELRAEYTELKGQAVGLRDKAKAEDRELTDEEVGQIKAWLDEGKKVTDGITALQDRNSQDERLTQFAAFGDQPQQRLTAPVNPNPPADGETDSHERRSNPTITGGPDSTKFASFGEFLQAVEHASHSPRVDPRLKYEDFSSPQAAASGLSETTPSKGGFLVEQQTMAGMWERAYETSALLNRIETVPIGQTFNGLKAYEIDETSRADGSRFGGVRAYWRAEAATVTKSDPSFREISLNLKDLMAIYYATNELLQDSVALESLVSKAISLEMQFKLEDSIINGTGAGLPLGILNSGCLVTVDKETGQEATTLVYENLVKMWARMWARSRLNSVFVINQDVEPQLFTMTLNVGTGGVPVYLPPGAASASPYGTIFGRPVIPVEYCATLGTAGDVILADFSQYLAIDKGGLQSASSMHVRFLYNEMTYRFTYRFDGEPIWNSALTPFKGTNTLSPFVALQTRS
jgi:HK97 family phage major capsid protein